MTIVVCPSQVAVTVITGEGSYAFAPDDGLPADVRTIAVGDVVRFQTTPIHDVVSGAAGRFDGQFEIDYDQDVCRRFEAPGRFSVLLLAARLRCRADRRVSRRQAVAIRHARARHTARSRYAGVVGRIG